MALGFGLFFGSSLIYYLWIPANPVTDALNGVRVFVCAGGLLVSVVSGWLSAQWPHRLFGYYTLYLGLFGLHFVLQALEGPGLVSVSLPPSLVLLFYIGQTLGKKDLVANYFIFVLVYITLYLLEDLGVIAGGGHPTESLLVVLFSYCSSATIAMWCCLAHLKSEQRHMTHLLDEQAASLQARIAESEKEYLYRKQIAITDTKERYLSFLAHEVKNPLFAMLSALDLIKDPEISDEIKSRLLKSFEGQIKELLPVIGNVLEAGKIQNGAMRVSSEPFNLRKLCRSVLDTYEPLLEKKGIEVRTNLNLSIETVKGDASKIRQVLGNYLSNAIKYSGAQTIELDLSTESLGLKPTGHQVLLKGVVRDNGKGLTETQQAELFNEYVQVGQQAKHHTGSGLGLSIVRTLATLMGGEAGVSSQVEKGSEFWFTAVVEHSPST